MELYSIYQIFLHAHAQVPVIVLFYITERQHRIIVSAGIWKKKNRLVNIALSMLSACHDIFNVYRLYKMIQEINMDDVLWTNMYLIF